MAVITVVPVEYAQFSGYEEPELPSGFWEVDGLSIGDGTGGTNGIQVNFAFATEPRNSQFFSLEKLSISHATAAIAGIIFFNLDILSDGRVLRYNLPLVANEAGPAALNLSDMVRLGLFLGRQDQAASSTNMFVAVTNDTGEALTLKAGGYIWGARSVAVSGGPQRPQQGLYSN